MVSYYIAITYSLFKLVHCKVSGVTTVLKCGIETEFAMFVKIGGCIKSANCHVNCNAVLIKKK